ncbi:MAG TPA: alkaline phosphatase family protein [Polyangiaceae bacterium]|nr:alkaline phosphatase family protein [Polyangiaceae bacterium]
MKKKLSEPEALTRRKVLKGVGAALGAAAAGCGGGGDDGGTPGAGGGGAGGVGGGGGTGPGGGGGGAGGSGGGVAGSGGQGGGGGAGPDRCGDEGGLSAAELLAPIETIVVLCMENRSFDHYLGALRLVEGRAVDGLTGLESNADARGAPVAPFGLLDFTVADPPHDWDAAHAQWNNGRNDGFVKAHAGPAEREVMGYHVREQLRALYALADASAVCERWFCSLLGPTWPNRLYLHGATSLGSDGNTPVFGFTSVFELLDAAGVTHRNYFHDVPWCAGAYFKTGGLSGIDTFFEQASAGTLPAFSIIDPQFFGAGANDDHPDHDIQLGQALIGAVYNALALGPQWGKCLFVLTYDEHGGFFDHVPPPTTVDERPAFAQLGFRVPSLVAGPFVRRGCAVSRQLEHVSVIKTLTTRFGLPSLNGRVDATNDLSCCIDPAALADPHPPVTLPPTTVSLSRLRARARRPRAPHHPEIWAAAEGGLIPRHLDRRREGDAITRRVLEHAVRLGAVRLIE